MVAEITRWKPSGELLQWCVTVKSRVVAVCYTEADAKEIAESLNARGKFETQPARKGDPELVEEGEVPEGGATVDEGQGILYLHLEPDKLTFEAHLSLMHMVSLFAFVSTIYVSDAAEDVMCRNLNIDDISNVVTVQFVTTFRDALKELLDGTEPDRVLASIGKKARS